MPDSDKVPEHVQWMGKLVVNLQSFEFALRGFLYNREQGRTSQGRPGFLEGVTKGQKVEENAFTNYDTLGKLIDKYNGKVRPADASLEVDPGIARIRDAVAHGRIAGLLSSLDEPLRLVKYDKPANGLVRVTDFHILTKDWFDEKIKWVCQNLKKVQQANELTGRT